MLFRWNIFCQDDSHVPLSRGLAMARTKAPLPAGAQLADYLTVGYLAMNCPIAKVR